ncbi:MAG: GlsB/YeaQ/YmgE family stress response membrane protein [Anaerolineae bacterium]
MIHVLVWILSGILAGWATGMIVRGRGFGIVGDLVIGLIGGLLGGWLFGLLGLRASSWLGEILLAVAGGILLVGLVRIVRRA